jgi:hypothetical protein
MLKIAGFLCQVVEGAAPGIRLSVFCLFKTPANELEFDI